MKKHKHIMEMDENWMKNHRNSKILGRLFVISAGVLLFLKQMGLTIPHWILSWEMILIVIGIVMQVKHNFKKKGAYILIIIGAVLMANEFVPDLIEPKFIWPILVIILGASMILKVESVGDRAFKEENNELFRATTRSENIRARTSIFFNQY